MTKITVEISPLAYAKIIDWAATNTEREIGGYLIGNIIQEKLLITEAVFAVAESNPTFVSFDNMMQFKILERLDERGKGEVILGWFHTHPGMQIYMSGTKLLQWLMMVTLLLEVVIKMITKPNSLG
ncbi:MAG: Mov34/MPN/PAD-1 family protein [Candidatus Heimdallarchaeota archaeon]